VFASAFELDGVKAAIDECRPQNDNPNNTEEDNQQ
jgi:hypothetical protein